MTASGSIAALLVALAALSARAEDPSAPKATRSQASADGAHVIRMTELSEGRCQLEALKDSQPVWQLERCLGTVDDLFFISNSGERFWVVKTLPRKPEGKRKVKGKSYPIPWPTVVVVQLFDREGRRLKSRRIVDLVPSKELEKVRHTEHHLQWLEGVLGVPGKGPRVNEKNELEFEVASGRSVKLSFGG